MEESADVLRQVSDLTEALRTAQDAIERIQQHLARMAQIADPQDLKDAQWQAERPARQAALDDQMRAIDQLAVATEISDAKLLDGTWSVAVADPSNRSVHTLRIPSLAAAHLGRERIGGFLSELTSSGANPFLRADLARSRAVIRCAMLQVAAVGQQVAAFVRDALDPLSRTLQVTTANIEAADSTIADCDFAHQASRLTRLDALVHACPDGPARKNWRTTAAHETADGAPDEATV